MKVHLLPRHQKTQKATWRQLNITALKDPGQRKEFQALLYHALQQVSTADDISIQAHWEQLKSTVQDTCTHNIGFASQRNQAWFDANDAQIRNLEWKCAAFITW
ncbi:hypothetical protein Y1Q_0006213 [Alligator mississippiensis]|uniref:Uncharacterized protein n=1 Tax=Alligator mississippiensis TaxID=8496 RepID=A0A151NX81_ALLMI|nr:hypothetical protein Y1Q_0006213 [Alligator mississippiensis]